MEPHPEFCSGRKVFALPNGYIGLYRDEQGSIIDVSGYGKVNFLDMFRHFWVALLLQFRECQAVFMWPAGLDHGWPSNFQPVLNNPSSQRMNRPMGMYNHTLQGKQETYPTKTGKPENHRTQTQCLGEGIC